MEKTISRIELKKAQLEVLERLLKELDGIERESTTRYEKIGTETEQARHWRTVELMWDDEEKTIPHYNDIYDYVLVDEKDRTEYENALYEATVEVRKMLEKMI